MNLYLYKYFYLYLYLFVKYLYPYVYLYVHLRLYLYLCLCLHFYLYDQSHWAGKVNSSIRLRIITHVCAGGAGRHLVTGWIIQSRRSIIVATCAANKPGAFRMWRKGFWIQELDIPRRPLELRSSSASPSPTGPRPRQPQSWAPRSPPSSPRSRAST